MYIYNSDKKVVENVGGVYETNHTTRSRSALDVTIRGDPNGWFWEPKSGISRNVPNGENRQQTVVSLC